MLTGKYLDGYVMLIEEEHAISITEARNKAMIELRHEWEAVSCPLCGDTKAEAIVKTENVGHVGRCHTCHVLYAYHRPTELLYEVFTRFYLPSHISDPEVFERVAEGRIKEVNDNIDTIEKYAERGKMLDVGASIGDLLAYARCRGWKVRGTDLSMLVEQFVGEVLRIDDWDRKYIHECTFQDGEFTAISMRHVIEHLHYPVRDLTILHRALADDGVLFITTPTHANDIEYFKTNHMLPLHLINYTRDTLEYLLNKTGFNIVEYKYDASEDSADAMMVVAKKGEIPK